LTKFSKYAMWILSLVGCVRPNNLVKNRFSLADAAYSISYSQSRKRRNFVHLYDGKLVSVRKSYRYGNYTFGVKMFWWLLITVTLELIGF
jgi:hypothetical protein